MQKRGQNDFCFFFFSKLASKMWPDCVVRPQEYVFVDKCVWLCVSACVCVCVPHPSLLGLVVFFSFFLFPFFFCLSYYFWFWLDRTLQSSGAALRKRLSTTKETEIGLKKKSAMTLPSKNHKIDLPKHRKKSSHKKFETVMIIQIWNSLCKL